MAGSFPQIGKVYIEVDCKWDFQKLSPFPEESTSLLAVHNINQYSANGPKEKKNKKLIHMLLFCTWLSRWYMSIYFLVANIIIDLGIVYIPESKDRGV